MKHTHVVRIIRFAIIAVALSLMIEMYSQSIATAQTSPFLVSPFYGTTNISQGWTSPFEPNHHAYDFTLNYQPVL